LKGPLKSHSQRRGKTRAEARAAGPDRCVVEVLQQCCGAEPSSGDLRSELYLERVFQTGTQEKRCSMTWLKPEHSTAAAVLGA
jgi:hypothetical protein